MTDHLDALRKGEIVRPKFVPDQIIISFKDQETRDIAIRQLEYLMAEDRAERLVQTEPVAWRFGPHESQLTQHPPLLKRWLELGYRVKPLYGEAIEKENADGSREGNQGG